MHVTKFFFVLALLLSLMKPYLVVAQDGKEGCSGRIRFAIIPFSCPHICSKEFNFLDTLIYFNSLLAQIP